MAASSATPVTSAVETATLAHNSAQDSTFYDDERVKTIVVNNFPSLGKLTAFRFIEWAQKNPGGVVSLPTGKTPEFFIKWVSRIINEWSSPEIGAELRAHGLAAGPDDKPNLRSLTFVQIDEFFPIKSSQRNSFHAYVCKFYLESMGLDPAKALLIDADQICDVSVWPDLYVDLSLRIRLPANAAEEAQKRELLKVDQWCQNYEARIRALGGIGFFLGGIGPDGHIAFNCAGSDHFSTTRLTAVNYETQAAAAGDLGGIEVSSKRLVITIGLGTIAFAPSATAIIIAAGEAKARIVADTLILPASVQHPGSVLHQLPNARFYITQGAAKLLPQRRKAHLAVAPVTDELTDEVLIDVAVATGTRLLDLTPAHIAADPYAPVVLSRASSPLPALAAAAAARLTAKIEAGLKRYSSTRFLHTEPHHDDVMLGYMASVAVQTRETSNSHHFACMTSGFNSVTNAFIVDRLHDAAAFVRTPAFAALAAEGDYFRVDNIRAACRDVWEYLDGLAKRSQTRCAAGTSRRFIRNLCAIYGDAPAEAPIAARCAALTAYLGAKYAGERNDSQMETLKGACREFEADTLWGILGWECGEIWHARLNFYTADIFNEEPDMARDVAPVLEYLNKVRPDIVTVALDPEASGPDTHYKVLQAVTAAVKEYAKSPGREALRVWGYRNVWFRFHAAAVNQIIPVSIDQFMFLRESFVSTFNTQREASFPSYAYNGPFSDIAQDVQQDQYEIVKVCLGPEWFHGHASAVIRGTRGFIFLKDMSLDEFYEHSRALKSATTSSTAAM